MLELRQQRRSALEGYFALNKQLRKQIHALIPAIQNHRNSELLLREVVGYRDILQRVVITPRIQQGLITARDQFAIDTTVYNMNEINTIAGKYGNPGMMLAAQISLSTRPEILISLDRKMRTQVEQSRRDNPSVELPSIWLVPLFEDVDSVKDIADLSRSNLGLRHAKPPDRPISPKPVYRNHRRNFHRRLGLITAGQPGCRRIPVSESQVRDPILVGRARHGGERAHQAGQRRADAAPGCLLFASRRSLCLPEHQKRTGSAFPSICCRPLEEAPPMLSRPCRGSSWEAI